MIDFVLFFLPSLHRSLAWRFEACFCSVSSASRGVCSLSSVVECLTHTLHYYPEQLPRCSEAALDGSARFVLLLEGPARWVRFSVGMGDDLGLKQQSRRMTLAPSAKRALL